MTAWAVAACVLVGAGAASAQQIGGTVTDTTGGVLPGVTVEARSPDIIEQVRTALTDGSGQYLIVALEPGTYSVTYSLPGFGTLVREGIQLTTGFTASVDVQLSVGDIAETVTVSGDSPVVDIQNNLQRAVMDRDVIDTVPTGKSFQSYALLVPGMEASSQFGTSLNQDSGGITAQTNGALAIHGARPRDGTTALNGMDVSNALSAGAGQMFGLVSDGGMEEMAVETAGHSAEAALGGVQINLVPREGANEFSGAFFGTFTGPGLQGENLDDDLRARGAANAPEIDEVWLVNPAFGGPIVQDRLWFFVQNTTQVADTFNPNVFAAVNPASARYVPDPTRPVASENSTIDTSLNLTWQASAQDKLKVYYSYADWKKPNALAGPLFNLWIAPEGSVDGHYTLGTTQVGWVRPATNRLLFEASVSLAPASFDVDANEFAASNVLGLLDVATFTVHRNNHAISQGTHYISDRRTNAFRGSMTYVTGTHNLKVGVNGATFREGNSLNTSRQDWTNAISVAGFPLQAQFWLPNLADNNGAAWGIYVQDQMTFDRLTVNAGLRYDRLDNAYPDQGRPASTWEPDGLQIPGNDSVVAWNDLQPRVGVAYDLFGDGKTALKASANRYGTRSNSEWSALLNPGSAIPLRNQTRLWIDGANSHFAVPAPFLPSCIGPVACVAGDGLVQGDPLNPAPNGELLSPNSNLAFGSLQQINYLDPGWSHGWGNRLSNWEITAGVQQELTGGVSLDVTYFRRNFINFALQDDRTLAAGDYDLATVDLSGLGISGVGPVTFPELRPEALGRVPDVLFTSANDFGGEEQVFNGVDVTINARLDTLLLQGGLATGTTSTDFCPAYDAAPEHLGRRGDLVRGTNTYAREFCDSSTAWLTQIKLLGTYTLPYDIQVSGTLQSIPGPERRALITVPLTAVAEALGRPSATGVAPGLNALEPGTEYGERFNQFDLRFTKIIPMGDTRLRAMFDIYNLFNANAVFSESYAQNNYLTPTGFMPPRLYRFAFQFDF